MQSSNIDHEISASVSAILNTWRSDPRWHGVERTYAPQDVVRLRGSVVIEHTLAKLGAQKLYQALTVSDQAQMREFYLSKVEEVDPVMRTKFQQLYRYY